MADNLNLIKISGLQPTTELKPADIIPISQDGQTRSIKGAVLEQNLLNKTDARYIENSQKGAQNGVATLNAQGEVVQPVQNVLKPSDIGVTVARLDSEGKIPNEQLKFGSVAEGDSNVVSGGEVYNNISGLKELNINLLNTEYKGEFEFGGIDSVTGNNSPSNRLIRTKDFVFLPKNSTIKFTFKDDLECRYLIVYDSTGGVIRSVLSATEIVTDSTDVKYRMTIRNRPYTDITDETLLINTVKFTDSKNPYPDFSAPINSLYKDFNTSLFEWGGYRYQNMEKVVNFLRIRTKDSIKLNKGTYNIVMHPDFTLSGIIMLKDGVYVRGVESASNVIVDDTFNEVLFSVKHKIHATINYNLTKDFYFYLYDYKTLSKEDGIQYPFQGMTLYGLGSSNLTNEYGTHAQDLAIANKMVYSYKAVAGAKFAMRSTNTYKSVVQQVDEYIDENIQSDFIIVSSGMNDNWHDPKSPIGNWDVVKTKTLDEIKNTVNDSEFGISTVYGSLRYIFEKLIPYAPNSKIILNIPFQTWPSRNNAFSDIKKALNDISIYYSLHTLNSFDRGGFSEAFEIQDSDLSRCTIDGIHTRRNNIINEYGRRVQFDFVNRYFLNTF